MDLLSQALRTLHLEGLTAFHIESYGTWGVQVPPEEPHAFCLFTVVDGEVWMDIERCAAPQRLHHVTGDVGLLFGGYPMVVRDSPCTPALPHTQVGRLVENGITRLGTGERRTIIRQVTFRLQAGVMKPLLEALAPVITLRGSGEPRAARIGEAISSLFEEMCSRRPGVYASLERLAEFLLLEVVRAQLTQEEGRLAVWLAAQEDVPIAAALELIHREPGAPWTVDSLAERVALSRTRFAVRFMERVGESPFRYLTRCRRELALRLLRSTQLPIHEVGRRVGYADSTAFHKAFKRWTGQSPGEVRGVAKDS